MVAKKTKTNAPANGSGLTSSYTSLSSLGAPVTPEEFTRLYNGPLADALEFLGEHIVGRKSAAIARHNLLHWQEERSKSNLRQPDTTRSDADKAVARLLSARKSSEIYIGQLQDRQEKHDATLAKLNDLQKELAHKKKLLLLLEVLEAKQDLRMKRIEAMTKAIDDSKNTLVQPRKQILSTMNPPDMPSKQGEWSRISNVKDSMAGLHSYNIRLSRLLQSPLEDVMLRLQAVTPRSFSSDPDHAQLIVRCISFAHAKAHQKLSPQLVTRSVRNRDLEAKMQSNKKKGLQLQELADRSMALRVLCGNLVASIVYFTEILPPAVRLSLQDESRLSKSHVDILRSLIAGERLTEPAEESFLTLVTQVCRMRGNARVSTILDKVEREIKQSHRRFNLVDPDRLAQPVVVDRTLIDNHRSTMGTAHDRATKLLLRKGEKSVVGRSLANDVEALLRESRLVIGLSSKD
ncbi:hypothetical protein DFH07DRAFT_827738 [Mycena maculata]|uniref:Uncharacterized protein n=1 Tax=Mycena maculata TaxID=230809 RepID=A0AAD7ITY0_9AGAR|nr:hypothetical protein DFH07DRAFT_827738 [Mycena maculata]